MYSDKVCLSCYLHYVSLDLLDLWSLWNNLAARQSYSRRTHPKQKLLPHHKYRPKYIWLNYYFSAEGVMGLRRTRLLIWWWGGLAVWATLSAELLTVFWSPPEPPLKMEHVVKENTTGSLRFELEKGWNFWIMISNYLAPAALAKQKTHCSPPRPDPLRLWFVFLFRTEVASSWELHSEVTCAPAMWWEKREDYDRKNVFAVSWNITNTVKCHSEWENRAVLIRLLKAGPLWLWLRWKGVS